MWKIYNDSPLRHQASNGLNNNPIGGQVENSPLPYRSVDGMTQPGTPPTAPPGIGYTRPPSVSTIPLAPEGRQTRGPLGPRSALPRDRAQSTASWESWQSPLGVDYSPPPSKPTIHLAPEVPQIRGLFDSHPTRSSSKSMSSAPLRDHAQTVSTRSKIPHSVEGAPLLPVTESTNHSTPSLNHPPFPPAVSHGTAKTIGSWMTGTRNLLPDTRAR